MQSKLSTMKKITTLFFVILLSLNALAQLEVKPNSFKLVEGFVNINLEKQNDSYEKPYAVLKIRTENIDDQQRNELIFKVQDNVDYEVEYKVGEVWLYISYFATYLQISHPELGSAEIYFPFDMVGKKGYELTIVSKKEDATGSGIVIIATKPEDEATITLNGKTLKKKTPFTNDMIAAGHYEVTVSKENFQSVTKTFEIYDGDTTYLEINMPYSLGKININSNPVGATVYIDDKERGVTPLKLNDVNFGDHELRIEMDGCQSFQSKLVVGDKELNINANIFKHPKGSLPGEFSVSEKDKVYFAQGDLQYYQDKYRFTESQLIKYSIGTFTKGTFEWNSVGGGPHKKFQDWGKKSISNAGSTKWRTLSKAEWEYVLNTRNTNSGRRFVKATIENVKGIILFPDNWEEDWYSLNYDIGNYENNIISLSDWTNVFESCGSVFLPNEYWTSTSEVWDDGSKFGYVWIYYISGGDIKSESLVYFDKSVRLVCPAK